MYGKGQTRTHEGKGRGRRGEGSRQSGKSRQRTCEALRAPPAAALALALVPPSRGSEVRIMGSWEQLLSCRPGHLRLDCFPPPAPVEPQTTRQMAWGSWALRPAESLGLETRLCSGGLQWPGGARAPGGESGRPPQTLRSRHRVTPPLCPNFPLHCLTLPPNSPLKLSFQGHLRCPGQKLLLSAHPSPALPAVQATFICP